jgi:hypothetical protein
MSSSIYEEALADVKKLREVAEQSAKNAIIDAVTPKIRELIEKQLLDPDSPAAESQDDILGDLAESLLVGGDDEIQLTSESLEALSRLVNESPARDTRDVELKSLLLQERLILLTEGPDDSHTDVEGLVGIKNEVNDTYSQLMSSRDTMGKADFKRIRNRLASLNQFLSEAIGDDEMKERNLKSLLDEVELRIDLGDVELELEPELEVVEVEDLEEPEEGEEIEVEEEEEEGPEGEEVEEEEEEFPEGALAEGDDVFFIDEDLLSEDDSTDDVLGYLNEDDEPLNLNEEELAALVRELVSEGGDDSDEDDDVDEGSDEAEEEDPVDEGRQFSDDTVVEISESMLRQELSRMRGVNESRTRGRSNNTPKAGPKVRKLTNELREYKKAVSSLRRQLNEANLFNAKLLYANRLLHNRKLSNKQRVNIVESIDSAGSLREVRLLYKSLSDSMANKGPITESARRRAAGAASRPTRTGSVSQELVPEADRWATLAGIVT